MRLLVIAAVLTLAACGQSIGPRPAPPVGDARMLLNEIIDAGLARDWTRLCANATGTCEDELAGVEHLAPIERPRIADFEIHQPVGDARSWTSGGVLFVLCGTDGAGDRFESEVLVFDDGRRLLAGAAVYWVGTHITFTAPGGGPVTVGEPSQAASRC